MTTDKTPPYGPIDGYEPSPEAREAYRLLLQLSETQRGLVLCWFCKHCRRHMDPGDFCHCENDE